MATTPATKLRKLMTTGTIAQILGETRQRIQWIVATRNIKPQARAGMYRLYDQRTLHQIHAEIDKIDAWKLHR